VSRKVCTNCKKTGRIVTFTQELCKTYAKSLHEVQQLHAENSRNAPECPCPAHSGSSSGHLVELAAHEVDPPPDRAQRRIGGLEVNVPALLAALQLPMCLP